MVKKQSPKGKLDLVKINLWVPAGLHAQVRALVDLEVDHGRPTSISKVYADALKAYIGAWLGR